MISCLCVTRGRVPLLARAVECFRQQTHAERELLIVYDADDTATHDFATAIAEPTIRPIRSEAVPRLTLGALRNLALREAGGDWIAQWDDDDWHAPARLARQWETLEQTQQGACLLYRWLMYDEDTGSAYVSAGRGWEGSIVARKDLVPAYPELARLEDTPVVLRMVEAGVVAALDQPSLYIYTFHGANTWGRDHWEQGLLAGAQPLGERDTTWVRERLGIAISTAPTRR